MSAHLENGLLIGCYNNGSLQNWSRFGGMRVWNLLTGELVNTLTVPPSGGFVTDLAFDDNLLVAVSLSARSISVWDLVDHREINFRQFLGSDQYPENSYVNVKLNGKYILGAKDNCIDIWVNPSCEYVKKIETTSMLVHLEYKHPLVIGTRLAKAGISVLNRETEVELSVDAGCCVNLDCNDYAIVHSDLGSSFTPSHVSIVVRSLETGSYLYTIESEIFANIARL